MHVIHEIGSVWNTESRILFLGTMPSPASRLAGFYYMHPRNRFWPVMEKIFSVTLPSVSERHDFLLQNNIALWDVLCRCDIDGAQDSSIKNAVPNNFTQILNESKISRIFCTGKAALLLYEKLCAKKLFCSIRRYSFHKSGKCFVDSGKTLRRIQKENICRRIPLIKLERIFGIHYELLRKYGKGWNIFLTFLDNCKTSEYNSFSVNFKISELRLIILQPIFLFNYCVFL